MTELICDIAHKDFLDFLKTLESNSVDLLLTDPPYAISRKDYEFVVGENSVPELAVKMDFGEWDHAEIDREALAKEAFRVVKPSGTVIIWYDLWKFNYLADNLRSAGFKMLRYIVWNKTNPVPINSHAFYLTNSREVAVAAVKGGKPSYHSVYDTGSYAYPIINHRRRFHPTQKPIELFKELVDKHSNEGDLVVDPFLGGGTTAIASVLLDRNFKGCDSNLEYVNVANRRVNEAQLEKQSLLAKNQLGLAV